MDDGTVLGHPASRPAVRDTSQIPFSMTDPVYIPAGRYTSEIFHQLEIERLWSRVWQVACREEDIPRPGDFIEYAIGDDSVLVLRTKAGDVRAYHNACRHRATQLGKGCGSFPTGQIVCPFHGWMYDLEGNCTYVYSPNGFRPDTLEAKEVALDPVKSAVRWGMVWINLDPDAESLEAYLGGLTRYIDPLCLERMRVRWWKQIRLEANWKVAQEAFFESYHVMQSHPEMTMFSLGEAFDMEVVDSQDPHTIIPGRGHWAHHAEMMQAVVSDRPLIPGKSNCDMFVMRNRNQWLGAKAAMTQRAYDIQEELLAGGAPRDDHFPALLLEKVLEDARARNAPIPTPTPEAATWGHIFPNVTFLQAYGAVLMYRSRPALHDQNACIFDFWALEILPEGTETSRPIQASDAFFNTLWVVHQDKGNIERQQVGLRTTRYKRNRLATSYEETISGFHLHLDQLLAD